MESLKQLKYKTYTVELIGGSKGKIDIPEDKDIESVLDTNGFIEDAKTKEYIRSNSIVKYKHTGHVYKNIHKEN